MMIFTKRTCKRCNNHMLDRSKSLDFWILVCGESKISEPITVSREYKNLSYNAPKWCPKKWRNR